MGSDAIVYDGHLIVLLPKAYWVTGRRSVAFFGVSFIGVNGEFPLAFYCATNRLKKREKFNPSNSYLPLNPSLIQIAMTFCLVSHSSGKILITYLLFSAINVNEKTNQKLNVKESVARTVVTAAQSIYNRFKIELLIVAFNTVVVSIL